jgi:hypothetical protein
VPRADESDWVAPDEAEGYNSDGRIRLTFGDVPVDYVDQLKARVWFFENGELPEPWAEQPVASVGGLLAVGFGGASDMLLVISHDGRGVFDARTGERVARDRSTLDEVWYSAIPCRAVGIGPLLGEWVALAGVHGGGLPLTTRDGWCLTVLPFDWPEHHVFLEPPGDSIFNEERCSGCARIDVTEQLHAVGFSETGKSFVIATASDVTFYSRL